MVRVADRVGEIVDPDRLLPEASLRARLEGLARERDRCLRYAAKLSAWSMFWRILLIAVGALVAAQAAFARIWGQATWVTVAFVLFGVITAAGSGYEATFKPGERSPQFAAVGFKYERLRQEVERDLMELSSRAGSAADRTDGVLRLIARLDDELNAVRDKELSLYVAGPWNMGRT